MTEYIQKDYGQIRAYKKKTRIAEWLLITAGAFVTVIVFWIVLIIIL